MTGKRNGWLKLAGTTVALIVGVIAIWTFINSTIAGGATREESQQMRLEQHGKSLDDHESRLRGMKTALDEQRPIWRAVARKLNVELPGDSGGP